MKYHYTTYPKVRSKLIDDFSDFLSKLQLKPFFTNPWKDNDQS